MACELKYDLGKPVEAPDKTKAKVTRFSLPGQFERPIPEAGRGVVSLCKQLGEKSSYAEGVCAQCRSAVCLSTAGQN